MDPPININKREVGKFAGCVFESLSNLLGQRVEDVRVALSDRVKVIVTNFGEYTGRSGHEVSGAGFFPKQSHFTKEFARVEVRHHHLLFGVLNVVDNHRDLPL